MNDKSANLTVENKEKNHSKKRITVLLCCVLLLNSVILSSVGIFYLNMEGFFERHRTVLSMDKGDELSFNSAQLAYYFELAYDEAAKSNAGVLNGTTPLKELKYTASDEYDTWYDYLLDKAKNNLIQSVCLAQKAKDEGIEIDDIGKYFVDNGFKSLKTEASNKGMELDDYIAERYGKGLNEQDLRKCMEINELAQAYLTKYTLSQKFTDDEINAQYDKSPEKYGKVTLKSYTFQTDYEDETSLKELYSTAKENAEKLGNAKSESEFDRILTEYLTQYHKLKKDKADSEYIKDEIADAKSDDYTYMQGDELCDWAFSTERKNGDTKIINTDNAYYEVYMVIQPIHRDMSITKNIRLIMSTKEQYDDDYASALTAAQTIKSIIQHDENPEQKMADLVKDYSADAYSVRSGGLYENVKKGDLDPRLIDWCYYDKRKTGDCDVVKVGNGYSTVYYVGNGVPSWQVDVIADLKSQRLSDFVDTLSKQYGVSFDDYNAKKLDK